MKGAQCSVGSLITWSNGVRGAEYSDGTTYITIFKFDRSAFRYRLGGFSEVFPTAARDRSCREDDVSSGCEDGHLATLISDEYHRHHSVD